MTREMTKRRMSEEQILTARILKSLRAHTPEFFCTEVAITKDQRHQADADLVKYLKAVVGYIFMNNIYEETNKIEGN